MNNLSSKILVIFAILVSYLVIPYVAFGLFGISWASIITTILWTIVFVCNFNCSDY